MSSTETITASALQAGRVDHSRHPVIEKFQTIDGLLRSHAGEPEQKPLICYPVQSASDFEQHTAASIDQYTDIAVKFYRDHGLKPADPTLEKAPVVALLAGSSFEVILTFFALNRLGYAVLFLSTRLTAPAYARLLGMAECYQLVVPEKTLPVVDEIAQDRPGCSGIPVLTREDWHGQPFVQPFKRHGVDPGKEGKKIAWILHSSGSTGFPKPIYLTNLQCLANFRKSFALRSFCVSPLFHSHALMELGRAFYMQSAMFCGNHSLPVTSANLLAAIQAAKPQMVSAVPYVLKLLAEKDEGIKALAKTQLVMYAGSSCPDVLGDMLVDAGVNLIANYGATETGQIMTSFRGPGDKEWSYMRLWQPVADFTLMDEIAPGVFECVGLDGLPSKGPSNSRPPYSDKNPPNSFRTADLFTRHPDPEKSNYYKYLSRLDDRITLVNGEKVLPIPIEGRIRQEAIVQEAVVFGFQQTMPGVLIFRAPGKATELNNEQFLEAVWPAVDAANAKAETFSRVIRELVVVKSAECVYPKTDKGTFIRAQVYQQFADDIRQAYEKLNVGDDKSPKLQLTPPELEDWLLARFQNDLSIPLTDVNADVFASGVDSLQTTRIWRAIKKSLDLGADGDSLSQNAVFEHGTVKALAQYLYRLRTGETVEKQDEIDIMKSMIEKYSHFQQHSPSANVMPETETALVTGATGNLGAFIVAELCTKPRVAEIWALVRAADRTTAEARLTQALTSRGIDLSPSERSKVRAIPADLSKADLGLEPKDHAYLLSSLTCVIHSAWAVNFNLGVRSFEAQHIAGAHNLINLCLSSKLPAPARFYFCSSVSTASNTPKPARIPEKVIVDMDHAQKTGYGRSKLVTEHISRNAMLRTGLQSRVLRIGQLSGDTSSALWNDTEAIALMVRSALTTGVLPALDERPSWLPVDVCARVTTEIALAHREVGAAEVDADLVYQLVNPSTFSYRDDFLPTLGRCTAFPDFEIVSTKEWLQKLERSEPDPQKNPSIKLLDFWRAKYGGSSNVDEKLQSAEAETKGLVFETEKTVQACPALRKIQDPVSEGLIERYAEAWMSKWRAEQGKS